MTSNLFVNKPDSEVLEFLRSNKTLPDSTLVELAHSHLPFQQFFGDESRPNEVLISSDWFNTVVWNGLSLLLRL